MIPLLLLTLIAFAAFGSDRGVITTWVPPYGIDECKENLMDNSLQAGEVLDRLGLWFWIPTCELTETDTTITGKIEFQSGEGYGADSNDVAWFSNWARERDVELLLCMGYVMVPDEDLTNENMDINSKLQKIAFHDNQDTLIRSLLDEMDRYDFDGIGLDFEHLVGYREEYARFVQTIADSVHSRGKVLSVCVMPSTQWAGVNSEWWEDYVGYADELLIMGYHGTYAGNTLNHGGNLVNNYKTLLDYGLNLGYESAQLSFGMPAWLNDWGSGGRGTSTLDHLLELRDLDTTVSMTFCDIRLVGNSWKDSLTWQTFELINETPKILIDEIDKVAAHKRDGTISIYWSVPEETGHHAKVISVRAYDSTRYENDVVDISEYRWRAVDTIAAEAQNYELDLSSMDDTLFTVMVAMVDEWGAVIDYDLTGTYFEMEQSTSISKHQPSMSALKTPISFTNGKLSLTLSTSEIGTVSLYDLSGRRVAEQSGFMQAGVNHFAIPSEVAQGNYLVQIKTDSFREVSKVQIR